MKGKNKIIAKITRFAQFHVRVRNPRETPFFKAFDLEERKFSTETMIIKVNKNELDNIPFCPGGTPGDKMCAYLRFFLYKKKKYKTIVKTGINH